MNPLTLAAIAAAAGWAGPWLRARIFTHTVPCGQPPQRHCPHCGHPLVPAGWRGVLAGLPTGGACPTCHTPTGPAGWLVEALTAATAVMLAWWAPSSWLLAPGCGFGLLGVALSLVDIAVKRLPAPLTAAATLGGLAALTAATVIGASTAALWPEPEPECGCGGDRGASPSLGGAAPRAASAVRTG